MSIVERLRALAEMQTWWETEEAINEAATHITTIEAEKAALVAEVERLRVALHEIDLEASNTIPPDGGDAAFGALDAILRIINPFRIERTAHDQ